MFILKNGNNKLQLYYLLKINKLNAISSLNKSFEHNSTLILKKHKI